MCRTKKVPIYVHIVEQHARLLGNHMIVMNETLIASSSFRHIIIRTPIVDIIPLPVSCSCMNAGINHHQCMVKFVDSNDTNEKAHIVDSIIKALVCR